MLHTYQQIIKDARGIMVIILGNGHSDPGSNPGQGWFYFTLSL